MINKEQKKVSKLSILTALKRKIAAEAMYKIFPYVLHANIQDIKKIKELQKSGTGFIFVAPHIDRGDFIRVFESIILSIPGMKRRKMIVPVAQHQADSPGLNQLSKFADIQFAPVVTKDTLLKQRNSHIKSQNQMKRGEGNKDYASDAIGVIKGGGIIAMAPQAGRRPSLESWEEDGKPIRTTDAFLRRGGVDNFAYIFLGIERRRLFGMKENNYGKRRGMNLLHSYDIRIGSVVTNEDLQKSADKNNLNLDEEARQRMLQVAPSAYRPK